MRCEHVEKALARRRITRPGVGVEEHGHRADHDLLSDQPPARAGALHDLGKPRFLIAAKQRALSVVPSWIIGAHQLPRAAPAARVEHHEIDEIPETEASKAVTAGLL